MPDTAATIITAADGHHWQPVGSIDANGKGIFVSIMYGDLESTGPTHFLMKYSAGVVAAPHLHSHDYYAVLVSGQFRHSLTDLDEGEILAAGATWFQKGGVVHQDACTGSQDCILSIFWPHGFDVDFIEQPPS